MWYILSFSEKFSFRSSPTSCSCCRSVVVGALERSSSFPAWASTRGEAGADNPNCLIRLTLAGHLHGGQVVLFERKGRLYPGACFSRWNGLRFEDEGATMWVSRGVADTLPLRWNCPREVLLCELS